MFSSPTKSCTKAPQILFIVQPFLMSSAHLYFLVSLFFSDWPCCCCCCSAVFSEIPLLFLPKSGLPASLRTNHWNCSTRAPLHHCKVGKEYLTMQLMAISALSSC